MLTNCILVALLAQCAVGKPDGKTDMSCAACGLAVQRLGSVLETTKGQLELSKETNEKRAASIDKVQKAQTKRWLKNEYGVALRASLEEEVETVCNHDTLSTSKSLQGACRIFLEEFEEPLVRAVLDGKGDEMCAASVGCSGDEMWAAIAAQRRLRQSDPVPEKQWVGRGAAVRRLVSTTFSNFVMDERLDPTGERQVNHVLLMLYQSSQGVAEAANGKPRFCAKEGGACVGRAYRATVAEFYLLAAKLNQSNTLHGISVGEMDLRGNELPQPTELADPEGVQFALFLDRDKGTPKLVPAVGEPPLAELGAEAFRDKLKQLAATYLKDAARSEMTKLLSEPKGAKGTKGAKPPKVQKAAKGAKVAEQAAIFEGAAGGKAASEEGTRRAGVHAEGEAGGGAEGEAASLEAAASKLSSAAGKSAPPRRKRRPSLPRREEECEACGLLVKELHGKLRATKQELQLSREAAARKEQKVDKVQKAQTKRWLKQEYSVALAASLEERVDGLCEGGAWVDLACSVNNSFASWYHDDNPDERWTTSTPPLEQRHCAFRRFKPQPIGSPDQQAAVAVAAAATAEHDRLRRECADAAKARCRSVVEKHIEAVMRAVLDSDIDGEPDTRVCVQLLPGCEAQRAACFSPKPKSASGKVLQKGSDGGETGGDGVEEDEEASAEAYFARGKEEL